mmetsp:Transcript_42822/g.130235  ORF Transcript_42822/g.130235 Transcript_42822/m.130235 type:complete len:659 (-) Transcript_42822:673-2649(-)
MRRIRPRTSSSAAAAATVSLLVAAVLALALSAPAVRGFSSTASTSGRSAARRRRSETPPAPSPPVSPIATDGSSRPEKRNNKKIGGGDIEGSTQAPPSSKKKTSAGEAIQSARTVPELLAVSSTHLWLPSDPDLPSHLRTQAVHHEKRRRWGSQLLSKLGSAPLNGGEGEALWSDVRLGRAVLAAALPFDPDGNDATRHGPTAEEEASKNRPDKEGRWIREALCGLHSLSGRAPPPREGAEALLLDVREGILLLLRQIEALAPDLSLREAAEARWAARGLIARLGRGADPHPFAAAGDEGATSVDEIAETADLERLLPILESRVASLPFDILPRAVDLPVALGLPSPSSVVPALRSAIPFHFDVLTTRTGSTALERRGTAWVAAPSVGALAYSGKLMPPSPLSPEVSAVMRDVESALEMTEERGEYFDCALCNHYPDGESACKFHTDPEHGSVWERLTCVVSAGESRRFAFRPIPGATTWDEWEAPSFRRSTNRGGGVNGGVRDGEGNCSPAVAAMFPGDVVKMWGECNDEFHHAVYPGDEENAEADRRVGDGRVSLVLKRAIDRGGGRRGHGLKGEGRRSRRRSAEGGHVASSGISAAEPEQKNVKGSGVLRSVVAKQKERRRKAKNMSDKPSSPRKAGARSEAKAKKAAKKPRRRS